MIYNLIVTTESSSDFTCTVEVDLHRVHRAVRRMMALGTFLARYVREATVGFVADLTRQHLERDSR